MASEEHVTYSNGLCVRLSSPATLIDDQMMSQKGYISEFKTWCLREIQPGLIVVFCNIL